MKSNLHWSVANYGQTILLKGTVPSSWNLGRWYIQSLIKKNKVLTVTATSARHLELKIKKYNWIIWTEHYAVFWPNAQESIQSVEFKTTRLIKAIYTTMYCTLHSKLVITTFKYFILRVLIWLFTIEVFHHVFNVFAKQRRLWMCIQRFTRVVNCFRRRGKLVTCGCD